MRMLHSCLVCALLWGTTTSPHAREVHPPEQIVVNGSDPLRLSGHARRMHLLGTVGLYTLALYSNGPIDRTRLASADVAKVLRINVTYEDDLGRPPTIDWRRELIPQLAPSALAHLRGTFAPLRRGDIVQIVYVPAKGTSVRVNRAVSVSAAHHDVMLAFLDHWLGERPVSEEIKRTLLASSSSASACTRGPSRRRSRGEGNACSRRVADTGADRLAGADVALEVQIEVTAGLLAPAVASRFPAAATRGAIGESGDASSSSAPLPAA